jgi:hypothetical protein
VNKVDGSTDGKRRGDDPSEVRAAMSRCPNDFVRWGRPDILRPHAAALSGGDLDSGRIAPNSSSVAISEPERAGSYGATMAGASEANHAAIVQASLSVSTISSSMSAVIGREK